MIYTLESRLSRRARNVRIAIALAIVSIFVLGPLSMAAYATWCHGWGHGGGHGGTDGGSQTGGSPGTDGGTDPSPAEPSEPTPTEPSEPTPTEPSEPTPTEPEPTEPTEPGTGGGTGTDGGSKPETPVAETPSDDKTPVSNGSPTPGSTKDGGDAPSGNVEDDRETTVEREKSKSSEPAAGGASLGVANAPVVAGSDGSGSDGASGNSKDSSGKASGSNGDSAGSTTDKVRERTTIARAVDGIPLGFRVALLALLFATAVLGVFSFRERRRADMVARIALLDHLTGLANREGFDRQMASEWQRAIRHDRPLGLVFVDLDHFKVYNDTHGHLAGDRLLREVAAAITATSRGSDFTARLGGDEFVVLCPETDAEGVARLIERLRVEASGMAVSLSIGAAQKHDDDEGPDDLMQRADEAMYRAKNGGKSASRRSKSTGNPLLGSVRRG